MSYNNSTKMSFGEARTIRLKRELEWIQQYNQCSQFCVIRTSPTNLNVWYVTLTGPRRTPNEQGTAFNIVIQFPETYPLIPPQMRFETKIFHPHIADDGTVIFDLLKTKWSPVLRVSQLLESLVWIITYPEYGGAARVVNRRQVPLPVVARLPQHTQYNVQTKRGGPFKKDQRIEDMEF